MDLPKNHFKQALKDGARQIGLWVSLSDPDGHELLAGAGFDWLMFDTEHATSGPREVAQFLRTIAPYDAPNPVTGIVRPGWNDPVEIKKLLDAGAQTLLVPYVQNRAEAEAAVAAITYPPKGIRGVAGLARASRYGRIANYAERAEQEICLLVQVETQEALTHLDDIAAVPGVDGIFFGPADLAASLGFPGQPSHPMVKTAILQAMERLAQLGKPSGILSLDQTFLQEAAEAGAQFIAIGSDTGVLKSGAAQLRNDWT